MKLIDHYIEEDVTGPARIVVPISEDRAMRAVFNGIARAMYDRPLQTSEEIEEVWERQMNEDDRIYDALDEVGEVRRNDDDDMGRFVEAVEDEFSDD